MMEEMQLNEEYLLVIQEAFEKQITLCVTIDGIVYLEDDIKGMNIPPKTMLGYVTNITNTGIILLSFMFNHVTKSLHHIKQAIPFSHIIECSNNYPFDADIASYINAYISACSSLATQITKENYDVENFTDIVKLFGYNPTFTEEQEIVKVKVSQKNFQTLKNSTK